MNRRAAYRIAGTVVWLALVFLLLPSSAPARTRNKTILPTTTDAAIADFNTPHRIYFDPAAPTRNELLLFLPGTGGRNVGSPRPFSVTAAELGYHVIELAYPNSVSATVCWRDASPDCFENFRREIIEGRDSSPLIAVPRADSIENRLEKLLHTLAAQEPGVGWGQYLDPAGSVNWAKIALAGQSQGGGHAALIAREHTVARVLLFGAPKDYDPKRHKPAAWYRPARTPPERFFALAHTGDSQGCSFPQQLEIYRAMGMGNDPFNVDGKMPPYDNSRILITSYPGHAISSKEAHVSGISNQIFKPVWKHMLTFEGGRMK